MLRFFKYNTLAIFLLFSVSTMAQLPIVNDMQEQVTLHQDSAITDLMLERIAGATGEVIQQSGYRVQVYSSNRQQSAKTEAYRIRQKVEDEDLQVDVYVTNNPPFWKVRVGNYRTKEEAELMKEELLRRLPELQGSVYVVPDKINVVIRKTH